MLSKDLSFAVRTLRKNPAFTLTAILTIALGIGASTAIFSVVNAVLLRPLPYKDPARLALIERAPPGAVVAVPRIPVARGKWFVGDDFTIANRRAVTAARYGLERIDLAPEP